MQVERGRIGDSERRRNCLKRGGNVRIIVGKNERENKGDKEGKKKKKYRDNERVKKRANKKGDGDKMKKSGGKKL